MAVVGDVEGVVAGMDARSDTSLNELVILHPLKVTFTYCVWHYKVYKVV